MQRLKTYRSSEIKKFDKRPGLIGTIVHGEGVTLTHWAFYKDAVLAPHSHHHEQIIYIVEGVCDVIVGNESARMCSGDMVRIPSNVKHDLRVVGDKPVVDLDVFTPIREDYLRK